MEAQRQSIQGSNALHSTFRLNVVQQSDVGRAREINEDAFGRLEPANNSPPKRGSLYVVADGMGGHMAGEVASQLAVDTILGGYSNSDDWENPADALRLAVEQANEKIHLRGQEDPACAGMGTTVVVAIMQEDQITLANVGDSRAYLLRDGQLEQLTRDHSWVAKAVEDGVLTPAQAFHHPDRNVIYRSLGAEPAVEVDTFAYELYSGDRILLCSDGLTDVVTDEAIEAMAVNPDLATAVEDLIDAANEGGGPDNITVTLIALESSHVRDERERPTPNRVTTVRSAETSIQETHQSDERPTEPRGINAASPKAKRRGWLRRLLRGD